MKYLACILVIYCLNSCTSVYFSEAQTLGGKPLEQVPDELQGVWRTENSTHVISSFGMVTAKFNRDSLDKLSDTSYNYFFLSDSLQIYEAGDYFLINLREASKGWQIILVEQDYDGNINWYYPETYPFCSERNGLKVEKIEKSHEIYNDELGEFERVNFSDSSLVYNEDEEILNVYYSGQISFGQLELLIKPDNLMRKYVYNGFIEYRY